MDPLAGLCRTFHGLLAQSSSVFCQGTEKLSRGEDVSSPLYHSEDESCEPTDQYVYFLCSIVLLSLHLKVSFHRFSLILQWSLVLMNAL